MTPEQKQRALELVALWNENSYHVDWEQVGNDMAALLQELVDAPEPEPVAKVMHVDGLNYNNLLDCDLPTGTLLYTAPPAPSVQDGWKHDCAGIMQNDVELWIDSCPHCGKPKTDAAPPAPSVPLVLPEMSKNHIECIALDAGIEYCGDGVWRASPARMRDFAQRCINDAIPAAPTPAEAPADVARDAEYWRNLINRTQSMPVLQAIQTAINAAMSEKGGA